MTEAPVCKLFSEGELRDETRRLHNLGGPEIADWPPTRRGARPRDSTSFDHLAEQVTALITSFPLAGKLVDHTR